MAFLFILPTWPVEVWTSAMRKVAPRLDVRSWPDQMGDVTDIDYAAAWLPPANVLKGLPNLKVIFSLGAGVDAILKDPTLPPGTNASRLEVVSDSGELKLERLGRSMPDNPKTGVLTALTMADDLMKMVRASDW